MAKRSVWATMDVETELKNNGVSLAYYEDDQLVGYLKVGKAKLEWFDKHGKKPSGEARWNDLIEWMKS